MQMLIIKIERLVVVIDLRKVRVGENVRQYPEPATDTGADLAGAVAHPAAFPLVLIFPVFGIAYAGLGLNVVKPGVFHAFATGPDVLAGDRTGVATDALVQVQHHADLRTDLHFTAS